MPLLHATYSVGPINITGSGADVFTHTMSDDGRLGVAFYLSVLNTAAATITVTLEVLDQYDASYDIAITEPFAKGTAGLQTLRVELERTLFVPSGFKVKAHMKSTNGNDTGIYCVSYVFDPNHATDLAGIEGQSLGSQVGENFNTLFDNASATSALTLSDISTPDDVNDEVLDVLNVETLIDGKTIAEALKIIAAVCAGKVSGAGTGSEVFRSLDDSANRVSITVDAEGNRTGVTYG
jgi:hypothetical protein